MKLVRTSIYTSISQALSIIAGLITVRVVSAQIGPRGMAFTGQFTNTTTILLLFATGAISTGVVKYLAQYSDDRSYQLKIIRTAFWVTIFCSLIVGTGVIICSQILSLQAFKTSEYYIVYVFWGVFLFFTTLSALMSNILNGLKQIRLLTIISISSTIIGLGVTIFLAKTRGVKGVLIAPGIVAFFLFLIHLIFLQKYKWFSLREIFAFDIDKRILKLLSSFFLMTIVAGLLTPLIQLFIRDRIITGISMQEAGYWQAATRISDYYLGFITSVLSVYYLPKLAELKTRKEIQREILNGYKIILPVVAAMSFVIWLMRYFIINTLMTSEFAPAEALFGFQFLGDFFKIGSWLLGYLILAKAMKYTFIATEIGFNIVYGITTTILINEVGLMGSVYGFAISYLFYWIALWAILKWKKEI